MRKSVFLSAAALSAVAVAASASETVRYTYDARGRLVKVERTGDVNGGAKVEYDLDKADNRKAVKSTKPAAGG